MSETEFAENDASGGGDEEPTMEEILSSIRRIISDDDEPAAEADEAATELDDDDDDEILELTEILAEDEPADDLDGDGLLSPDDIDDLEFSQPELEPELDMEMAMAMEEMPEPEVEATPEPEPAPMVEDFVMDVPDLAISDSLISEQVGDQVNQNFHLLANTLLAQNGAGPTVEGMVMALMRPMLKSWLDENLPVMVEKIVREEIERVARGGKM